MLQTLLLLPKPGVRCKRKRKSEGRKCARHGQGDTCVPYVAGASVVGRGGASSLHYPTP